MSFPLRFIAVTVVYGVASCAPNSVEPKPVTNESAGSSFEERAFLSDEPNIGDRIDDGVRASPAKQNDQPIDIVLEHAPRFVDGYRELFWEDLLPEGEMEQMEALYQRAIMEMYSGGGAYAHGTPGDVMKQFGTFNAVEALDGVKVRLPGYTVPFDLRAGAQLSEFLLVPYFGACIHAPPPPPNQTIMVKTDNPIKLRDLAQAIWVHGTLKIEVTQTELADTAYVIALDEVLDYQF